MTMRLHVGTNALRGGIRPYAERFDFLELTAEPGALPRPPKLRRWRADAPDGFVFSIVLPGRVAALDESPEVEAALAYATRAAAALEARWFVLKTPASVTPSTRSRRRLAALLKRLPSGVEIAWDPSGVWQREETTRVAAEHSLVVVTDVSREPPPSGPVLYARLSKLAAGRVTVDAALRAATVVRDYREAFVVVEGQGAAKAATLLRGEVEALMDTGSTP